MYNNNNDLSNGGYAYLSIKLSGCIFFLFVTSSFFFLLTVTSGSKMDSAIFSDSTLTQRSGTSYSSINASATSTHHRSVRDALAELNLKTRLLEDERDYYVSLHAATDKAYEHHRFELQSLLIKERELFAMSERAMQDRLRDAQAENDIARQHSLGERDRMSREVQRLVDEMKADSIQRSAQMRAELAEHTAMLQRLRDQNQLLVGEKEGLEDEIRLLLKRQEMLRAEIIRRRAEQRLLLDQNAAPKPFIPNGKTQRDEYAPASHNVNALISTIHNRNFLLPGEHKRYKSPQAITPLHDACGAILRELMDLRLEYHLLAEELNKAHTDVPSTTARLREILQQVERKKSQLKKMRSSQRASSDDEKLHVMLKTIAQQNNMAERLYSDLIACIRAPY